MKEPFLCLSLIHGSSAAFWDSQGTLHQLIHPGAGAALSRAACTLTFLFLGGLSKRTKPQLSSWLSYKLSHHCSSHCHAAMPTVCLQEVKSRWTSLEPRRSLAQRKRILLSRVALPAYSRSLCISARSVLFFSKCKRRIRTIAHTSPLLFSSL